MVKQVFKTYKIVCIYNIFKACTNYSTGPDLLTSFEAINNVDCLDCEKPSCMRKAMKSWNKSVQWWLKYYIFLRVPIKSFRFEFGSLYYLHFFLKSLRC